MKRLRNQFHANTSALPLRRFNSHHRHGLLLLEMIVALILLAAVTAIVIPTLGWMNVQNQVGRERREAVQTLHNLMEDLTTRPYAKLQPEAAGKIELPDAIKHQLPGAKLVVIITETKPAAKRIKASLSWKQKTDKGWLPCG